MAKNKQAIAAIVRMLDPDAQATAQAEGELMEIEVEEIRSLRSNKKFKEARAEMREVRNYLMQRRLTRALESLDDDD